MNYALIITAVNGFLVVLLGAFGAHALEAMLSQQQLETWDTAVQYHMFHTAALFGTGLLCAEPARQYSHQPRHQSVFGRPHRNFLWQPLYTRAHRHQHARDDHSHRWRDVSRRLGLPVIR